jgi:hypothetical protein
MTTLLHLFCHFRQLGHTLLVRLVDAVHFLQLSALTGCTRGRKPQTFFTHSKSRRPGRPFASGKRMRWVKV